MTWAAGYAQHGGCGTHFDLGHKRLGSVPIVVSRGKEC